VVDLTVHWNLKQIYAVLRSKLLRLLKSQQSTHIYVTLALSVEHVPCEAELWPRLHLSMLLLMYTLSLHVYTTHRRTCRCSQWSKVVGLLGLHIKVPANYCWGINRRWFFREADGDAYRTTSLSSSNPTGWWPNSHSYLACRVPATVSYPCKN